MDSSSDGAKLAGRILLAAIFIWAGVTKIPGYEGYVSYMGAKGLPALLLPPTILLELVGGIMLAIGFYSRWTALAIAGFTLLAAVIFHWDFGNKVQAIMFMKNLAITGGLLYVWADGPGRFAINQK